MDEVHTMAKAASPIRLQSALMEAATLASQIEHRSATEQVEYWADIGRKLAKVISIIDIARIQAGLAKVTVEEINPAPLDSGTVFSRLETMRDSGELSRAIASEAICYQASKTRTGMLDQIHPDGTVVTGQFVNGEFRSV
ncbi:TA system antitoxin ParD family protein [Endozoicomonas sp.]|uniref:TA system antitoxin ParD family protein n=1 Tax=Endozoicomonas sp. TaxID=1892382 RepID=UPI00383B9CF4